MTPKQEEALRDYLQEAIVPLIEQVLVKKLGQAMTFAKKALAEQPAYRAVKTFHEGKPVYVAEQPAQPTVPDALTPADKESPEYTDGWNDCRQAMLAS